MTTLAIIAGGGALPRRLAEQHARTGGRVFVIAYKGQTDPATVDGFDHAWHRLGETDKTIRAMRQEGVDEVVMAGPMRRPSMSELKPDFRTLRAFARAGSRVFGDDGLLSVIIQELEEEGFRVRGVQDILGGYLAPRGQIAGPEPDEATWRDIRRGLEVLRLLAPADVGQAVAVQEGLVLAVEAVEGTDAMIARAGEVRREGAPPVLVKTRKRGQEDRADLPTVGPGTVEAAVAAGFGGIAVEADSTLLIDQDRFVAAVDDAAIFAVAVDPREILAGGTSEDD
jgi:DUF1009 family protein